MGQEGGHDLRSFDGVVCLGIENPKVIGGVGCSGCECFFRLSNKEAE